jgi:acetyl-CoA carboxylase carboxyl transferase subunit beta
MRLPAPRRLGDAVRRRRLHASIELPKSDSRIPLKFRDRKRYTDRLKEAREKSARSRTRSSSPTALLGRLPRRRRGRSTYDFQGGSMGIAVGEGFLAAAKLAVLQQAPLPIAIPASGGARMQEGILSLMQLPRTVIAVQEVRGGRPALHRRARRPHEPAASPPPSRCSATSRSPSQGAVIGFAGARVIEETIREKLPPGSRRPSTCFERGQLDIGGATSPPAARPAGAYSIELLTHARSPAAEVVRAAAAQPRSVPSVVLSPRRVPRARESQPILERLHGPPSRR